MTRINARLDAESAADLEFIRQRTGSSTLTEALKYSLHEVADRMRSGEGEGRRMTAFMDSDYIGCGAGPKDLSENYKDFLGTDIGAKHGVG